MELKKSVADICYNSSCFIFVDTSTHMPNNLNSRIGRSSEFCFLYPLSPFQVSLSLSSFLRSHNDVVDGNVDELDEEADESHDGEADGGGHGNLLELFPVWLCAFLYETDGILGELPGRVNQLHNLIHGLFVEGKKRASG